MSNGTSKFIWLLSLGMVAVIFSASCRFDVDSSEINTYLVSFDKNNSDLSSTEANPQSKTVTSTAKTIDSLPEPPIRVGYAFNGWNTQADGSGKPFTESTPVKANITVFAQWILPTSITLSDIPGVAVPATGGTPVKTITETAQFTGIVSWSPNDPHFIAETTYMAEIGLTPKEGYTLQDIPINFFTVAGAVTSNPANSGLVTVLFPPTKAIEIEMILVPGGSFEMGKNLGTGGGSDFVPVHTVTISKFFLGRYPVTQEQYQAVMYANPSYFNGEIEKEPWEDEIQARRPVETITWYDALVFCNTLSSIEGLSPAYCILGSTDPADWGAVPIINNDIWNAVDIVPGSTGYRMPTEAQWEYASKGGDNSPDNYTYSGGNDPEDVAWSWENSNSRTHEVGLKNANSLGFYDMSGNVREWCWDWWDSYTSEAITDPTGASSGEHRVTRGGSWNTSVSFLRCVNREYYGVSSFSSYRNGDIGLRLVRPSLD